MSMQGGGYGLSIVRHSSTSEGIHRMSTPSRAVAVRLAIIGGGPRAISVLERLAAHASLPAAAAALQARPLHIDVIDPHMPGSGRIWRADESPLLLLNSRAQDVTIFSDESVQCSGPVRPGPSLAEWAADIRAGHLAAPTAGTQRLREIEELGADDFASRRVQALYLEWFFGQVLAALPSTVQVTVHRATASAVHDLGRAGLDDGDGSALRGEPGRWQSSPGGRKPSPGGGQPSPGSRTGAGRGRGRWTWRAGSPCTPTWCCWRPATPTPAQTPNATSWPSSPAATAWPTSAPPSPRTPTSPPSPPARR